MRFARFSDAHIPRSQKSSDYQKQSRNQPEQPFEAGLSLAVHRKRTLLVSHFKGVVEHLYRLTLHHN
jgi:hypothetical protein